MKKIKLFSVLIIFVTLLLLNCSEKKQMINTENIKNPEIEKYLGTWYETARFDHSFERNLVGVTATYSILNDGLIKVINQGYKNSLTGKHSKVEGKAKIPDKQNPGKLKVSFFWFFYADYFILELDEINYSWAAIGSSSDKYLWILSRTPQMKDETYNLIIEKLKKRGYKTEKLIKVIQNK